MKQIISILFLTVFLLTDLAAQVSETSLSECRQKAVQHSPLQSQYDLLEQSMKLKKDNISKNYLPQLNLNAQATYQSDVTKVSLDLPPQFGAEIPVPDKDQYKAALEVNQVIYDGGKTSKLKEIEEADYHILKEKLEVELYNLKERTNNLYFNILMLKKKTEMLALLKETMESKLNDLQTAERYGTALTKDVNVLHSEILQVEQQIKEANTDLQSLMQMLSDLTEEEYSSETEFIIPEPLSDSAFEINRPEYRLLTLNQNKLSESKDFAGRKLMPGLYGFGQAGYGKPGLNMLSDEFNTYYLVGARLQWKFWDWNNTKQEKQIISLQQDILETQKKAFEKNLRSQLDSKLSEIRKYRELIELDDQIIAMKNEIAEVSSSQLDNGVITSAGYVEDINAMHKARLQREIHKIQLIRAGIEFLAAKGDL